MHISELKRKKVVILILVEDSLSCVTHLAVFREGRAQNPGIYPLLLEALPSLLPAYLTCCSNLRGGASGPGASLSEGTNRCSHRSVLSQDAGEGLWAAAALHAPLTRPDRWAVLPPAGPCRHHTFTWLSGRSRRRQAPLPGQALSRNGSVVMPPCPPAFPSPTHAHLVHLFTSRPNRGFHPSKIPTATTKSSCFHYQKRGGDSFMYSLTFEMASFLICLFSLSLSFASSIVPPASFPFCFKSGL